MTEEMTNNKDAIITIPNKADIADVLINMCDDCGEDMTLYMRRGNKYYFKNNHSKLIIESGELKTINLMVNKEYKCYIK